MSEKPREPERDSEIRHLAKELGATLRRVVSESTQVALYLARARSAGFEISLALDATVVVNRRERGEDEPVPEFSLRLEAEEPAPLRMTPLDRKFLRSLKIAVEEDD